ncbi:5-(carboxyamino)imidazole ribonucleotide synthase [Halorhodospira halochloris]|uniref:N5-carboxyaminoimidazole ribonucleotide synthase n=1 Tax=Halorhodospira halochloris TaxID=1052 RepID=A0A0X8XAN2_HALHR|nr:5-(carboxyamino)imidazole ribonucleotide synthase [Halorhodospira halochloris]MBK1651628.1 5-(carboxyamino)imidazole ribonucleotide synthase [Halorhodospira halochloris]MCG5529550.1 5-(carboxyamino)imidazole ribonucleotide synthase [Halorhodospira halochloris]MCG5548171.1 5-(carboxyamino)imidazole ribonucleotide synthase [Halorhodospira halochloris]BAU58490.1 phosphoribosylaminoimidazole carboxylase ATPase subunit [Halorhodospira halochloris]
MNASAILPGANIGILGGGQLGRMLALAARRSGYQVQVMATERGSPAGQVSDRSYGTDLLPNIVQTFAKGVAVLTYEFENIPLDAVEAAAEVTHVRPSPEALRITQNRSLEKDFLRQHGLPTVEFETVNSCEQAREALQRIGVPAVIKSAGLGYDGKGQVVIEQGDDIATAWTVLGTDSAVVESRIDLAMEVSVVAARSMTGEFAHYGVIENRHRDHVLDLSIAEAQIDPALVDQAVEIARTVGEGLDIVGTYCVELFIDSAGQLLVNEIAPRPHNSGHLTIEGAATSQFDQQLRAVCGMPLGSTEILAPAAMVNLLGDVWAAGPPPWAEAFSDPAATLHLYGKRDARPGRKMGHITVVGATDRDDAAQRAMALRSRLAPHLDN